MQPIAIVAAFVAALFILGRGPLVVAPAATVAFYRRALSTPGRLRILGVLQLVLIAAPLVITARQAPLEQHDITIWFEGMGWFTAAAMIWVIAFPGLWQRLMFSFWDAASDPDLLRTIGVLNVAIGLGLGWVAFFVL
jgi:uncharacterized protein YjeT (DUF2065 family)